MNRPYAPRPDPHFSRFRRLAQLLDAAVTVPGTRIGVGLDFVLGLLPGAGDAAAGALGLYGLYVARRLGAPSSVLLRMAGNVAVDAIVGSVPVIGDLVDVGFRSNLRNLALLEAWLDAPQATRRASRWLVLGVGVALVGLLALVALATGLLVAGLASLLAA